MRKYTIQVRRDQPANCVSKYADAFCILEGFFYYFKSLQILFCLNFFKNPMVRLIKDSHLKAFMDLTHIKI